MSKIAKKIVLSKWVVSQFEVVSSTLDPLRKVGLGTARDNENDTLLASFNKISNIIQINNE